MCYHVVEFWHQRAHPVFALHFAESIGSLNIYSMETAVFGRTLRIAVDLVFIGNIDFAKPRKNWFQQFVFVLDDDEKARCVAEELDAASESRLCVDCEFIRVVHYDALEEVVFVTLNVGFCKLLEFVSDEFDSLAVGTVDKHDIILDSGSVELVDTVDEIADNGSLSTSSGSVKNNVGNFSDVDEIIEL
jgi:hypothetical protein